jgi:NET1-associated nuclear protein 1 (U3 small nucleolar RNA-associated protein 17)
VAVSPCNDRVAAGDATGRILTWHGVGPAVAAAAAADDSRQQSQQQDGTPAAASAQSAAAASTEASASVPQPVVTSVHWHAHAVRALAFSLDAQRLLSGGDEAVLVRPPSLSWSCLLTCLAPIKCRSGSTTVLTTEGTGALLIAVLQQLL